MTAKQHRRGTHRVSSPEETRSRVWPLLKPLGITRVANITGLDFIGIPVVAVYRPNARSLSVAQGKGCTLTCAEVSGVMESIEFYHAENISEPLLHGSFNQLRFSKPLLSPELLPRSAVGRYNPELKLSWISGVDLVEEQESWVPYELVHTDFTLPFPAGSGCFPMTSNGLASGNHLWEAVSHGISEVIERDAATLFSLLPEKTREARRVRLASVDAPECIELLQRFEDAGVVVAIFDMTSDNRVPVFRAVIVDAKSNPDRPLAPSTGTGCHPARSVALARALTEAAQSRLTMIAGSRDDLAQEQYQSLVDVKRLHERRAWILQTGAAHRFQDTPNYESDDVGDDVAWQKERLMAVGIEHVVAVDLTKPELGIPVVRVIIPGLELARDVPGWVPGQRARRALARSAA
ncbi:MAG TPA: YcaO-like family protein [Polyangiaceae bacterium]|nr:YcaO-like family protein [Polyangiaceae bacterium]